MGLSKIPLLNSMYYFQRSVQCNGVYFTGKATNGTIHYDIRKWISEKPTKYGQSLNPQHLTRLIDQLYWIGRAVTEARKGERFERKFLLGSAVCCTVTGPPFYNIDIREWYLPDNVYEERWKTVYLHNWMKDLRPFPQGVTFHLNAFEQFRNIAREAILQFGMELGNCENPRYCPVCNYFVWNIERRRDPYETPDEVLHIINNAIIYKNSMFC